MKNLCLPPPPCHLQKEYHQEEDRSNKSNKKINLPNDFVAIKDYNYFRIAHTNKREEFNYILIQYYTINLYSIIRLHLSIRKTPAGQLIDNIYTYTMQYMVENAVLGPLGLTEIWKTQTQCTNGFRSTGIQDSQLQASKNIKMWTVIPCWLHFEWYQDLQ